MRIFITGGAGYIGSHMLIELLQNQHEVHVLDNYANSCVTSLERVARLTNQDFGITEADICDFEALDHIFQRFKPDAVIHFAGLKSVAESTLKPIVYYDKNVFGTIQLLKAMNKNGCGKILFSSSATVYGIPERLPLTETHPLAPVNPYGRTKYFVEEILRDWTDISAERSAVLLRYFNPVGAHQSGDIGEDPRGTPNNLVPYIAQVAVGRRTHLNIFGNDYDTHDGTGVRDYIHISDLATGHLAALDYMAASKGVEVFNLGTGEGYSVLSLVKAFEKASGKNIPVEIAGRRAGDVAASFADASKAKAVLGWQAKFDINRICVDAWRWQSQNPDGYKP